VIDAKSLHTAGMIVAFLPALALVGCPPPGGEGEGAWGGADRKNEG